VVKHEGIRLGSGGIQGLGDKIMTKPQLILDIGGVLAKNFSPLFWQELSKKSEVPYDKMFDFKNEIREDLWSGKISEEVFWTQLCDQFPSIEIEKAQLMLRSNINPLSAMEKVPKWSQFADIHLLSNHRLKRNVLNVRHLKKGM
jgi:putative hydrolase of the HAD superfamily